VDPDFAEALTGEVPRPVWNVMRSPGIAARWNPWSGKDCAPIEVVCRSVAGTNGHGRVKRAELPQQLAGDTAF
jgi:hypothetical protein